ncbi:L-rhamnose-binding lectin SML [Oryzias melastigma]|uniref:L-rhamnose-binding lectin SML-like n=1 Tax=Oryzias melastigma TaxID=30732 RepID=A0A3B3BQU6_ORYME|nr:L-rhamnose-binding lectin SML [Oryzias melastigma]
MQLFRLSATMLVAAVCLFMASGVSTETVTTCVDFDDVVHRLECEKGVISVESALYGRANSFICHEGKPTHQTSDTNCHQSGAENFVKSRCNNKTFCEINRVDVSSEDPCYGTYKYLQTNFTCIHTKTTHLFACQESYAHLKCDYGMDIYVLSANYGRNNHTICSANRTPSQIEDVTCSNPTPIVAQRCNGRNSCTIRASNSVFGAPCDGTYKYLDLTYACQYPTHC